MARDVVVLSINLRISRPISDARKSPRSATSVRTGGSVFPRFLRRARFLPRLENRETRSRRDGEKLDGVKSSLRIGLAITVRGVILVVSGRRIFDSTRPPTANPLVESLVSDSDRCLSRRDPIVSRSPVRVVPRDRTESGGKEARKNGKTKEWKKRRNGLKREVASLFAETGTRSRNRVRAKAAELWSRLHGSYSWPRWPLSRISDSTVGAESRLEGGDAAARRSPSRSASPSPFVCVSRRFCCSLHTVTHTGPFVGEGS